MGQVQDECESSASNRPADDWENFLAQVVSEVVGSLGVEWKDRQNMQALFHSILRSKFNERMVAHDNLIAETYLASFQDSFEGMGDVEVNYNHAHHAKFSTLISRMKGHFATEEFISAMLNNHQATTQKEQEA